MGPRVVIPEKVRVGLATGLMMLFVRVGRRVGWRGSVKCARWRWPYRLIKRGYL